MAGVVADDDDDGHASSEAEPATKGRRGAAEVDDGARRASAKPKATNPEDEARRADFNKVRDAIRKAGDKAALEEAWNTLIPEIDRVKAHSKAGHDMLLKQLDERLADFGGHA
jgi:hypothetical protein